MIYGQLFSGLVIVGLGVFVFRLKAFEYKTKTLIQVALLTLLSFVLALISWMIPVMGFPALKIGVSQLPLMLVGFMFGPAWAFLAGLSSDLIELLSGTITQPFFGFTLNKILVSMIPALIMMRKKPMSSKWIYAGLGLITVGALAYVLTRTEVKIGDVMVLVTSMNKVWVSLIILTLSSTLMGSVFLISKQTSSQFQTQWMVAVICVELLVQLTLTPIWLYAMFGLPIQISVFVRLIKAVFMIPLMSFLGIVSLRVLKRIKAL